jgi:hypothetical protein
LYIEAQDLKKVAETLNLQQMSAAITRIRALSKQFPEVSPGAKYRFYYDLFTILNDYLNKKFPKANKGNLAKIFNIADKDEAPLRSQLSELEANFKSNQQRQEQIWKLPLFIRVSAFLSDAEFNIVDLYKNPDFRNVINGSTAANEFKATFRLKNISQNLMSHLSVESPVLEGNSPTLSAYKTMKLLRKFKAKNLRNLSPSYRRQVEAAIKILEQFLQFSMKIEFHHFIQAENKEMVEERIADLAADIKMVLLRLPANVKLAIPTGFKTNTGGHAAAVELSHDGQGRYQLSLVETGCFAEVILNRTQFRPARGSLFTIQSLTLHDLLKTPLLEDLLRAKFYAAKDSTSGAQFMLRPFLSLQGDPRLVIERNKVSLQHSKICTNATANALVELNFDPELYKCFDHFKISHSLEKIAALKSNTDQSTVMLLQQLTVKVEDCQTTGNNALELLTHIGKIQKTVRRAEVEADIHAKDNEIRTNINLKSQASVNQAVPALTQRILPNDVLEKLLNEEKNIAALRAMIR